MNKKTHHQNRLAIDSLKFLFFSVFKAKLAAIAVDHFKILRLKWNRNSPLASVVLKKGFTTGGKFGLPKG